MKATADKINQNIFYYRTRNGREIDFLLKKGNKIHRLIQVCFNIEEPDVKKRELKAFTEANEELNCDDLKFIPLWRWLLDPLKEA